MMETMFFVAANVCYVLMTFGLFHVLLTVIESRQNKKG